MQLLTRTCFALAFASSLTAASSLAATAQQPAPAAKSRSITLNVVASGAAANGLALQDFKLLDNKSPRPITSLREVSASKEPARVILVIDTVNMLYTRTAYVRTEVEKYLKANGGHLAQPTTFMVLGDKTSDIEQGFSTDGNALSADLDKYPIGLHEIRRDEGVWGANERTNISLKALEQLTAYGSTLPGRKIVLWISPGWPLLTGVRTYLDDKQQKQIFDGVVSYSTSLRLANVTLYNINPLGPEENLMTANYYQNFTKGIRKPGETDMADLSLQVISAQSGGLVLTSNSDVAGNVQKCIDDTKAWYELKFDAAPAEHPNEYHHVQVNAAKPGVALRTRDGYYAQP